MDELTLPSAQAIVAAALARGRADAMQPLAVVVLDARGALKAFAAEDGTSIGRAPIALGKAGGAIGMGLGTRAIATRPPQFLAAVGQVLPMGLVPVPGGVLVRSAGGAILGAVGVSGDVSENDETAAVAGILAAGFVADTGAPPA
jgi:uncharacterized protein GlcG (DUF336 family)